MLCVECVVCHPHWLFVPSGYVLTTLLTHHTVTDFGIYSTTGVNMAELVLSSVEVILNSDSIHVYLITCLRPIVSHEILHPMHASVYPTSCEWLTVHGMFARATSNLAQGGVSIVRSDARCFKARLGKTDRASSFLPGEEGCSKTYGQQQKASNELPLPLLRNMLITSRVDDRVPGKDPPVLRRPRWRMARLNQSAVIAANQLTVHWSISVHGRSRRVIHV